MKVRNKEKLTHIQWSKFPKGEWITVVIDKPKHERVMVIPRSGTYAVNRAYMPQIKDKRYFNLILPAGKWEWALKTVPQELRQDFDKPVQFDIKKGWRGEIYLRNWKVL